MPKPTSSFKDHPLARAPKYYISAGKDQGPELDRVLNALRGLPHFLITSRTGSRNGQHAVVRTNFPLTLRRVLAHVPGIHIQDPS